MNITPVNNRPQNTNFGAVKMPTKTFKTLSKETTGFITAREKAEVVKSKAGFEVGRYGRFLRPTELFMEAHVFANSNADTEIVLTRQEIKELEKIEEGKNYFAKLMEFVNNAKPATEEQIQKITETTTHLRETINTTRNNLNDKFSAFIYEANANK